MHEVQKYITHTDHGYIGYVVVVNKKFWDGLPADIRSQLEKAMKEATVYTNEISAKENADAFEEIRKSGKSAILELNPTEWVAMRNAMQPVYKEMTGRLGPTIIDEFLKEAGTATH
jgi:C4-dicarboxylate-binding protein DctP